MRRTQKTALCRTLSAFSIVEVTLVVVILAMLGAMGLPRYAAFAANQQLEGAARRITADLAYAQRNARQSSAGKTVVFDILNHSYTLTGVADPDHPLKTYTVRLADEPYQARIVSASFGGDAQLVYDGFGTPDSAGTLVIAVGSTQKTITVEVGGGKPKKGPIELVQIQ